MSELKDVFGYKRNAKPYGVFSSEGTSLTIGDANTANSAYLVQNWDIRYSQDVQELFELGSDRLYWAKGRPVGQGTIGRVVGALGASISDTNASIMPQDAFDICAGGATMVLNAAGGHCDDAPTGGIKLDKGVQLTMGGVVVTSLGYSTTVSDARVMEGITFRFAKLQSKG